MLQNLNEHSGPGNFDADPRFVDPGHWDDNGTPDDLSDDVFIPGDYRLLADSPCIDAGDPAFATAEGETDLDGNPRLRGCRVDIGAYESPRGGPNSGDFDGDGQVTPADIGAFVDSLLTQSGSACIADLNDDGHANAADMAAFLAALLPD